MIVREFFERKKEKLLGHIVHFEDYRGYKSFAFRVKEDTSIDCVTDPVARRILEAELVGIHGDPDDYHIPHTILTSRYDSSIKE